MKKMTQLLLALSFVVAVGCGDSGFHSPGTKLMNALTFGIPVAKVKGEPSLGEQIGPHASWVNPAGPELRPGSALTLEVAWDGGPIDAVNLWFGDGNRDEYYFQFRVPTSVSSGVLQIPTQVSSSLDLEEASSMPCHYQVGSGGHASYASSTEVIACTQDGDCTPAETPTSSGGTSGGLGSTSCQCDSTTDYCNGKTLTFCACPDTSECYYEIGGNRYSCAAGCECSSAAQSVVNDECTL